MSRKKVVIDFDEQGNPQIDGQGFVGIECHKFISEIQQVLGQKTGEKHKKEFQARVKTGTKTMQTGRS